jgi:hypothetical protein
MRICFCFAIGLLIVGCIAQDKGPSYSVKHYEALDEKVKITGRVTKADSVTIYWSGTTIRLRVKGGTVKAYLRDERGKNNFNVVVDGDSLHYIELDTVKRFYTLVQELDDREHTVELIKRNEWDQGKTWFYGIQVTKGELLEVPEHDRVIEFFGNSITAGYALDDTTGRDNPSGTFTNNYDTYAAITARHFNADYYCTVKSGIGILISWFPLTMPELYDRLDPSDSLSKWDFKTVQPQVVVINLFQNDSWLVNQPQHEMFKKKFGKIPPGRTQIVGAYRDFVSKIREVYPDAHIICALGSMDATKPGSPWPSYVQTAVDQLHDKKMHTLFFPYVKRNGHPTKEDNKIMADMLIKLIEDKVEW